MSELPILNATTRSSYRLDTALNEELKQGQRSQLPPPPHGVEETLPIPVFPRNPLLYEAPDEDYFPNGKRHYSASQSFHHMKGWMFPYFRSRFEPGEFHPIITY